MMKSSNRYMMTFEGYKQYRLRLKRRRERKKEGELNQKRINQEKKNQKPPFNPDETTIGVDQ